MLHLQTLQNFWGGIDVGGIPISTHWRGGGEGSCREQVCNFYFSSCIEETWVKMLQVRTKTHFGTYALSPL